MIANQPTNHSAHSILKFHVFPKEAANSPISTGRTLIHRSQSTATNCFDPDDFHRPFVDPSFRNQLHSSSFPPQQTLLLRLKTTLVPTPRKTTCSSSIKWSSANLRCWAAVAVAVVGTRCETSHGQCAAVSMHHKKQTTVSFSHLGRGPMGSVRMFVLTDSAAYGCGGWLRLQRAGQDMRTDTYLTPLKGGLSRFSVDSGFSFSLV